MIDDQDRCDWVNVSSGTAHPGSTGQRAIKGCSSSIVLQY